MAVAIRFSDWPFATWISKLRGSSILKLFVGACCLIPFKSIHRLLIQLGRRLLGNSWYREIWRDIEHFFPSFQHCCGGQRNVELISGFIPHKHFFNLWSSNWGTAIAVISIVASCWSRNDQSCNFSECSHRCHNICCFQFWWMITRCCDCFCCVWRYF